MLSQNTEFLNFKPTDGFRLYTDALLCKLMDLAPSDSSSSSFFEKREDKYLCKIKIVSTAQSFEALIESVNPKSAFEEARRRIIRQLGRWRRSRFARNMPGRP